MHRCTWCDLLQPEHLLRKELGRWFCQALIECKLRKDDH